MSSAGKAGQALIVLLGTTAVGKTALALDLAEHFGGEIVSADSRLIYRGMDIGTAKPTPVEQARVPHHLIDLVDPDETLTLAQYQRLAFTAIDDISQHGRLPFLVGGTNQYINAVVQGWSIPEVPPNETLRQELETYAAEHGPDALHARLDALDPAAAATVHPNNVRRVVRYLEICLEAGQPVSELQQRKPPPYSILQIGLQRPRDELYARIDARIDQMMADGLLEEVQALQAAGYDRPLPALSGLGYAQLLRYLHGECTLDEALDALRHDTRVFVRNQDTWFRKYHRDARWFEMTDTATANIIEHIDDWLTRLEDHATTPTDDQRHR